MIVSLGIKEIANCPASVEANWQLGLLAGKRESTGRKDSRFTGKESPSWTPQDSNPGSLGGYLGFEAIC